MFRMILPVAVISIAAVLLCFYHHLKKRREQRNATVTMQAQAIRRPEDQVEVDTEFDRRTPCYSIVEQLPPYSLVRTVDPKLRGIWPGVTPPPYHMYPLAPPLASHWITPLERGQLTPPTLPCSQHRSRRASFS